MSALLEVQNLVKRFPIVGSRKVVQAVNGVDFTIESRRDAWRWSANPVQAKRRSAAAVVGLIEATAGEIRFDGKQMGRGRNIRSQGHSRPHPVGVPGAGGIARSAHPRRRDHGRTLALSGTDASRPRARACATWPTRLGLAERALDQFPAELSAGQQQRVGIGRAIVTRPQLIVLDEPTSALDPTARAEIVDLLRRLQHEFGTAYLFISHDLSTVRFLSHRVAVLYLGNIVEEADSEELFAQAAASLLRRFARLGVAA